MIVVTFTSSVSLTEVTTADLDSDFEEDFANATETEMNEGAEEDEKVGAELEYSREGGKVRTHMPSI